MAGSWVRNGMIDDSLEHVARFARMLPWQVVSSLRAVVRHIDTATGILTLVTDRPIDDATNGYIQSVINDYYPGKHLLEPYRGDQPFDAYLNFVRSHSRSDGVFFPCEPRFAFKCPQEWTQLEPTESESVRHCAICDKAVVFCQDREQFSAAAKLGMCVAVKDPMSPVVRHITGRPAPFTGISLTQNKNRPRYETDRLHWILLAISFIGSSGLLIYLTLRSLTS